MAAKRPWLRLYRDAIKSPKIGRLTLEGMGFWAALLMLSEDDGTLPSKEDVSWHLRLTPEETEKHLSEMVRHGLVTRDVTDQSRVTYKLHDWEEHQCISDADMTARDRKQRQREREKAQKSAVTRDVTDMSRVTSRTGHGDVTRTESESESEKRRIPPTPQKQKAAPKPAAAEMVFEGFCLAMNLTPNEVLRMGHSWAMAKSEYAAWIEAGAIPELDIWPTVKSLTARFRENNPGANAPGTPRYFTSAILKAVEVRKTAMPETVVSSIIVGPNGKVLAPNGLPWRHPQEGSVWQPDMKFWIPPSRIEYSIEDAKKLGYLECTLWDLEGNIHPWVQEPLRNRLQIAQDGVKWTGVYLYGRKREDWPVREPGWVWKQIVEMEQSKAGQSNLLPPNWQRTNDLEVA